MKFIFKVCPRLGVSRLIYKILQDHQHFPFYPLSSCTNLFLLVAENGHFIWSFPSREIHVYGCLKELQNDKVGLTPWASIKYLIVSSAGSQFIPSPRGFFLFYLFVCNSPQLVRIVNFCILPQRNSWSYQNLPLWSPYCPHDLNLKLYRKALCL